MANVKRLCPHCGVANSMDSEMCRACGGDMQSNLPVPLGERLPVPWKQVGTSLAVGAGALALRAGLRLAQHLLERQATRSIERREQRDITGKVTRWLARRHAPETAPQPQAPQPQARVRVWGQRVWGRWSSDGGCSS